MDEQAVRIAMAHIDGLACRKADTADEAGLKVISLPWPRTEARDVTFGNQPADTMPIGEWPGATDNTPRRLLLTTDHQGDLPDALPINLGAAPKPAQPTPTADYELFNTITLVGFKWEQHLARIRFGDHSIGLTLGLRTGGEVHWWEACKLIEERVTPFCREIRMGGAIAVENPTKEKLTIAGFTNPYLHKHNWLYGDLFMRLYANGVCEVYARHTSTRYVDDGCDFDDVVPVIGFAIDSPDSASDLVGDWDGSRDLIRIGDAKFDMRHTNRLATPEKPGRFDIDDQFVVWQPYMGVDAIAGGACKDRTGDRRLANAADHKYPRGMTRTLNFSFSLSDRSPRICRYVAPTWWYGHCAEFTPQSHLPVRGFFDERFEQVQKWFGDAMHGKGFDDGAVPRSWTAESTWENAEPGWEGETPYGQFLLAWRTGDPTDYERAMRSAYHYTDVAIDHAANFARMHAFEGGIYALPMNRTLACTAAYLENGDPYMFETAESIVESAYRQHKGAWPRMGVGRDASFARSAAMLYRYFNNKHFLRMAREGAMAVVAVQRDSGSFGDQGGGSGIHSWGAYITKPWMGLLATGCVLDCLELAGHDPAFDTCIRKFADWLMAERWTRNGDTGWSYQHDFDGKRDYYNLYLGDWVKLPDPSFWHQENLSRVLGYASQTTGDGSYLEAYMDSYVAKTAGRSDHVASAAMQFLPWISARLWRASLTEQGVAIDPTWFGAKTPQAARIVAPEGDIDVQWDEAGKSVTGNVKMV